MAKKKAKSVAVSSDWTPAHLVAALRRAHRLDRVHAMKASGVLTRDGKLSKRYRTWGKRVTVTEVPTR